MKQGVQQQLAAEKIPALVTGEINHFTCFELVVLLGWKASEQTFWKEMHI